MTIAPYMWVLPAAFVLDLMVGDPIRLPHPIRLMGRGIEYLEERFRNGHFSEAIAGSLLALILVFSTWFVCAVATMAARAVHPVLGLGIHVVLIFYALSVKSLKAEALKVYKTLREKDLDEAKKQLSMIVGRDVESLDEAGVTRAAVETVAENLVDGIIAPLFFAVLGGGPLAMAYKMVNTLDSMIGHKTDRYVRFGRFAARLDDAANFIPARVSAIVISFAALLIKRPLFRTARTAIRDGRRHLSPNAGIPEAAFAGALGVRLGGPNFYEGCLVEKPHIGMETRPIEVEDIKSATSLMMVSTHLWFVLCWGATWIFFPWWP